MKRLTTRQIHRLYGYFILMRAWQYVSVVKQELDARIRAS